MQMKIKTAGFEGPLDLLLHLIKQLEIDIYDIPMAEITEQYMLYIHAMQELELDVASEYLVMAATLLAIKSEMLLPKHEDELEDEYLEEEDYDPRQELVERLLEYRKFKEASLELKEREQERSLMFTKPPSDLSQFASERTVQLEPNKVTIYDMLGAFNKLLRRQKLKRPLHTKVTREEISLEERMEEILQELEEASDWVNFYDLFPYYHREHIVVTFLGILELLKRNEIDIRQEENFDDLWVIKVN